MVKIGVSFKMLWRIVGFSSQQKVKACTFNSYYWLYLCINFTLDHKVVFASLALFHLLMNSRYSGRRESNAQLCCAARNLLQTMSWPAFSMVRATWTVSRSWWSNFEVTTKITGSFFACLTLRRPKKVKIVVGQLFLNFRSVQFVRFNFSIFRCMPCSIPVHTSSFWPIPRAAIIPRRKILVLNLIE